MKHEASGYNVKTGIKSYRKNSNTGGFGAPKTNSTPMLAVKAKTKGGSLSSMLKK